MSGLLSPQDKEPPRHGQLLLQLLVLLLFGLFTLRFWYLQVHEGREFARKARANQLRQEHVYAPRGLIRARDGELLATNEPAYALGIVREECQDVEATLDMVSRWLDLDRKKVERVYLRGRGKVKPFEPLIISQDLSFEQVAAVEANKLRWPGLEILVRSRRNYAFGELFCHVLGYVAEANENELEADPGLSLGDHVGKLGLEQVLEPQLRGVKGVREFEVDVTGRRMAEVNTQPPEAGQDVTLSIDLGLQQLVHDAMQGKEGVVVVMDSDTGQIMALVSAPTFDANHFTGGISTKEWRALSDDPMHPLLNRVTQSAYPPGSVFKLVMAGCGLHENMLNPSETVFCPGYLKLGSHTFRCWRRGGHGNVNLRRALVESCDVYFYRLGMKLGVDRISKFSFAAGFGKPTGIDLPHEKGGNIPTREWKEKTFGERWQKGEDLNFSIGQGYTLVTPLQVARYISALINGGKLLKPQLLADAPPEVQSDVPLDEYQRMLIKSAMVHTVVDPSGTCWRARTPGVTVGAKTGTAQVTRLTDELKAMKDHEIPYRLRDHAWMAGFGERDGRRYAVVVMVEHGLHGSSGAGPVVKACLDYLFPRAKRGHR
ncbi:penicillin-binding protein 2 [Paucidesulfovibrio gracilis DSM 16080]|uniref:Penicillin-binding protein 2 n=1 Tax=Paucidesulfovibrio gracilis DSM 16080 TaxID=1121449 RepID=A0A1T4XJ14_9BACT|nr:penicillin-binding protein 2 [Paucidesulfovibrio gracilis]SKA89559.1 penicillin-binding protein 2 [Paucidesulfovibrio gracilis DSM 16080]